MRSYSPAVESRIEDATRILTHYFKGSGNENEDMRAEIRDVVCSILDASSILVGEAFSRAKTPTDRSPYDAGRSSHISQSGK
jgi:hypothetical protein